MTPAQEKLALSAWEEYSKDKKVSEKDKMMYLRGYAKALAVS